MSSDSRFVAEAVSTAVAIISVGVCDGVHACVPHLCNTKPLYNQSHQEDLGRAGQTGRAEYGQS